MINGQRSTALALAKASAMAYANDGVVVGYGTCQASITKTDSAIIVAYKGTDNPAEWMSNLDRHKVFNDMGGVHRGFYGTLNNVHRDVLNYTKGTHLPIWFTGHSRGGAHALISAARFVFEGITIAGVYTFGSPRVGDSAFARWCNKHIADHHRFVYQSDIVTRLPRIGYKHCGQVHWHDGHEWRRRMPLHSRIGAWLFARQWPFIGDAAKDHSIQEYIGALA